MRRHFSTIDSKTKHELILSECSYNQAMDWLSRTLAEYGSEINRTETHINGLVYIWTGIYTRDVWGRTTCAARRMFFYDEARGYLLGE